MNSALSPILQQMSGWCSLQSFKSIDRLVKIIDLSLRLSTIHKLEEELSDRASSIIQPGDVAPST